MTACPCGSGDVLDQCCGPRLSGERPAETAEALMRSRYTAYALQDARYLTETHHPDTCDPALKEQLPSTFARCQWTRLCVLDRCQGGSADNEGTVTFEAHYTEGGKPFLMRETSRFTRTDEGWRYLDGQGSIRPASTPKTGRNDPCWCGSGKKYKKCHAT